MKTRFSKDGFVINEKKSWTSVRHLQAPNHYKKALSNRRETKTVSICSLMLSPYVGDKDWIPSCQNSGDFSSVTLPLWYSERTRFETKIVSFFLVTLNVSFNIFHNYLLNFVVAIFPSYDDDYDDFGMMRWNKGSGVESRSAGEIIRAQTVNPT